MKRSEVTYYYVFETFTFIEILQAYCSKRFIILLTSKYYYKLNYQQLHFANLKAILT